MSERDVSRDLVERLAGHRGIGHSSRVARLSTVHPFDGIAKALREANDLAAELWREEAAHEARRAAVCALTGYAVRCLMPSQRRLRACMEAANV